MISVIKLKVTFVSITVTFEGIIRYEKSILKFNININDDILNFIRV